MIQIHPTHKCLLNVSKQLLLPCTQQSSIWKGLIHVIYLWNPAFVINCCQVFINNIPSHVLILILPHFNENLVQNYCRVDIDQYVDKTFSLIQIIQIFCKQSNLPFHKHMVCSAVTQIDATHSFKSCLLGNCTNPVPVLHLNKRITT